MSAQVARVLEKLQGVRRTGHSWIALCPAHRDRHPSLAIAEGAEGLALVICRAGCRGSAVLDAIGLKWPDLFPPRPGDPTRTARTARPLTDDDRSRRDVLGEARRQQAKRDQYAEINAEADSIRVGDRVVRAARAVATELGPRDDVLELLQKAAVLDTLTRAAEAGLDAGW